VQRLFATVTPWVAQFCVFCYQHFYRPDDVYLQAGDEVVVTKVGKHTSGLKRFFPSL
jgi:hypothetical protein